LNTDDLVLDLLLLEFLDVLFILHDLLNNKDSHAYQLSI